ncbi:MAG TPA: competence/damage-inducible protein A [Candidatus Binataceae bacterium]|nr:competence/damage-inducible protein A [Candidatus Binataceae bacterium]
MRERTAGIVVVGNEILSGKVQDTNAYFAAQELRRVGVALRRISVVPDELDAIAEEVRSCARSFDFVLTSGGVGPTHDDITIEGIARAFARRVVIHPELEALVREHFGDRLEVGLKMAEVPEGAVLNADGDLRFPTVQLENVYILPGIPQLFQRKLRALMERFATDPYFIRVIYSQAGEGVIAPHLNACLKEFPELLLGSYPRIGESAYRVKLTLESKRRDYVEAAFQRLLELLPHDAVVGTE